MSFGHKIDDQAATYFLTFTVVDWVDVFTRKVYRDIILDSFSFCRKEKGLKLWAFVVMTNHLHCILSASNANISCLIRDFKKFTAQKIIKTIQSVPESREDWMLKRFEFSARRNLRSSDHQFWIHDNHPIKLTSPKWINQKIDYIHNNPVKAGWVRRPEDWIYSSVHNYQNMPGLIEIDLLDVAMLSRK